MLLQHGQFIIMMQNDSLQQHVWTLQRRPSSWTEFTNDLPLFKLKAQRVCVAAGNPGLAFTYHYDHEPRSRPNIQPDFFLFFCRRLSRLVSIVDAYTCHWVRSEHRSLTLGARFRTAGGEKKGREYLVGARRRRRTRRRTSKDPVYGGGARQSSPGKKGRERAGEAYRVRPFTPILLLLGIKIVLQGR